MSALRQMLRRFAPPYVRARRARNRRLGGRRELGLLALAERFTASHGTTVLRGPMQGLRYPHDVIPDVTCAVGKLLGSYERELTQVFTEILEQQPRIFVDIGAADGYYAVGGARRLREGQVYAFEMDRFERRVCRRVAKANEVDQRIAFRGECTSQDLLALDLSGAFVLSDCEGGEFEIFDRPTVEHLAGATVLVEVHHVDGGDAVDRLVRRFSRTHTARFVPFAERNHQEYPELADWSPEDRALVLSEFRSSSRGWVLFSPKAHPAQA